MATPGAPLLTIEREGAYRLEAAVEESRVKSIHAGQPVAVNLEALGRTLDAHVSEIVPAVDAASRAYTVKIDLPALAQLRSGMFGRAVFSSGARNVLAGEVISSHDGAVNSEVAIQLTGGVTVIASITRESVHALGLQQGDKVSAIVKASNVLIGI